MGSRSSDLGANLSQSLSLGCETRNRTALTLLPPPARARGTARASQHLAWPLFVLRPITHLTRRKISHLYNAQTVRLADVVVGRFCYTIKGSPVRRCGRVLWPGPKEGAAIKPGGRTLRSVGRWDIEGRGAEDESICYQYRTTHA